MAICSRAATMSSLCGVAAMQPKDLWSLVFRVLPKLLGLPPSLLKKFHVRPPPMEFGSAVGTLPELPLDILMDILATLDITDLVRAGSVCSLWRSAYANLCDLGKYKQSQTPRLFYTSESDGQNVARLYSLIENRTYKLTLPEPPIRSRSLIGSSNGWLVTADEKSELHLLNPITGEQIGLPSVTTIEHVKPITNGSGIIHKYELSYYTVEEVYEPPSLHALNDLRDHLYYKAFVFPCLSTGSYIVVLIHNPYYQLSFARAGDDKWIWLPPNSRYRDCIYMDGLLYALTSHGEINAFDLTASTITMKVIMDEVKDFTFESMYIIRAPWGDLLQVWRTVNVPHHEHEDGDVPKHRPIMPCTLQITIYKVDLEAKELVEIKSLPYHMLFLGHNSSLCLSADEHPQLKGNHAYFTDDHNELIVALKNDTRDIGVMDLANSRMKEIVSQSWSNWPCPTWITPSLTKMDLAFSR